MPEERSFSVLRLRVHAGFRDAIEVPCEVRVELQDGCYTLRDEAGFKTPAQVHSGILSFIIPFLRRGESRRLELIEEEPHPALALKDTGSEVVVSRGGFGLAGYRYASVRMPYVYPLNVPEGPSLTEDSPRDHPHHHSLWTAHGDVNGVDFWAGEGRIRHLRFKRLAAGPVYAEIFAENSWESEGTRFLTEERRIRFWNIPSGEWLIDYEVVLHPQGEVILGDTKEAGTISLRVASSMRVQSGGALTNSWGGSNEREVWGRRAEWCDYSGPLAGTVWGITVFDHPDNPRHPTYWHARDYGLMTANVFGLTHFVGRREGEMRLAAPTRFLYRLLVHRGWPREARVGLRYLNWIYPPTFEPVQ